MTKQQLQEYYWLRKNIHRLERRIGELKTVAERQTSQTSKDQERRASGGASDRVGNAVAEYVSIEAELQSKIQSLHTDTVAIEKAIAVLPSREQYLIRIRYIDLMTWKQIAADMECSWPHVHRIHSNALKLLAENDTK
ncbi:sigma factor-like helix-turn-helix DNA-binding protein [Heliophilum fasciatum]|uniref:RNA polymerase sigma factor (Sigma-70 family) n=1 Tax=Heliophilum fasciatum TaxID=35700 RepID=A0A4R2RPV6_9FIRM|nr:sigma factor-like helix-turn-helix DNA-binding protein [Heliophilum fasciatum]MCW2277746.1 RNA polymerase sigma factor (sigma-70 family) [Heliophilum fasciatum]TCP64759.1 RNA polymerase sigma factor (sigma-70 family) [Heliophilum fasciatum]